MSQADWKRYSRRRAAALVETETEEATAEEEADGEVDESTFLATVEQRVVERIAAVSGVKTKRSSEYELDSSNDKRQKTANVAHVETAIDEVLDQLIGEEVLSQLIGGEAAMPMQGAGSGSGYQLSTHVVHRSSFLEDVPSDVEESSLEDARELFARWVR